MCAPLRYSILSCIHTFFPHAEVLWYVWSVHDLTLTKRSLHQRQGLVSFPSFPSSVSYHYLQETEAT